MNIFITGKPRTGKTTLIQEVVDELDLDAGGMICPEIREKGRRKGFKIIDIDSGEKGVLAHVDQKEGPKISKYRVNMKDLEEISQSSTESALEEKEAVIIDEIGKMELYSETFREEIEKALSSDKLVLAVLHRYYIDEFGERGKVFELKKDNFTEVKKKVKEKLEKF